MNNTLIIEIRKGGLGDHLFYSHLPRIAKQTFAYKKVLISNHSYFRNPDYKKLIWELNPFVDGFTETKGVFYFSTYADEKQNMLDSIMLAYGLDDGIRMHEPELFYTPIINDNFKHINVYDPNYQSYTGDLKSGHNIENWLNQNKVFIHYQMRFLGKRQLPITIENIYGCSNIFEFCDFLASINHLYCLTTGSATLAAALHKNATVFFGNGHIKGYRHSLLHKYVYLGSDYGIIDYLRKWLGFCFNYFFKKD